MRRVVQAGLFVLFLAIFFWMLRPGVVATGGGAVEQPHGSEFFLMLDPLVSLSTAVAAKAWVWSLPAAAIILGLGLVIPRVFCGYICPMGTLIDLCDWAVGRRVKRFAIRGRGWWVHLKYYVLAGVFVAAIFGVLLSGFFSAIPVLVRGMAFLLAPLQVGVSKGWDHVPPTHAGHAISIALFLVVLGLGLLRPRFWCRYVCPTGALFSLTNLLRLTDRKVEASCGGCGQCKRVCPFDAVADDFTTRGADCAYCQTCGGVCPKQVVQFAPRWSALDLKPTDARAASDVALSRRGFLIGTAASGVVVVGTRTVFGARVGAQNGYVPVRPPCSVPEQSFLQMCIRCQACTKACPSQLLQPLALQQGLEGLWTPYADTDASGCDPNCHRCSEACPTKAIRAVGLAEKQAARMGLAIVSEQTCLSHAGVEQCTLCYDACKRAGHEAIELVRVRPEIDDDGAPVAGSGFLAPSVQADKCVGCGLCQSRCVAVNVRENRTLSETAIRVHAGPGREDRLAEGSYLALREQERRPQKAKPTPVTFEVPEVAEGAATLDSQPASQPASDDLPGFMQ